jgi:sugar (pentulose or hexulose) kinase
MATPTGQVVVALANASGVPVVVTNMAQAWVAAACAVIGGTPVSPPANAVSVPVKAANVPPPVATSTSG